MARHMSFGTTLDAMTIAGFPRVEFSIAQRWTVTRVGREVLSEAFLVKSTNSLLAILNDDVYEAGLGRIRAAVEEGESNGTPAQFPADLRFGLVAGYL